MERVFKLREWIEGRRSLAFELIRIYLGVGLFAKGVYFISHPSVLLGYFSGGTLQSELFSAGFIGHYVALAHLAGGLLLMVGLVTRLAAAVQIPILLGAVFAVHLREGLFGPDQNLEFSILVLFLLALTAVHGGGAWSADHFLKRSEDESLNPAQETSNATEVGTTKPNLTSPT